MADAGQSSGDVDLGKANAPNRTHPTLSPAFLNDPIFYRKVAHFMGWSLVISLLGAATAFALKGESPQIFTAVASGIVGAFAGVMAVSKHGG